MQDAADGNLNGADTGLLNVHLQECAACREDYRQTSRMLASLKDIPVPPSSPGFADRVLSNATRSQPVTAGSRSFRLPAGIAASLFLLFLTATLVLEPQFPSHRDANLVLLGNEVRRSGSRSSPNGLSKASA